MVELTHLCEYGLLKGRTVVVCCLARLFHQLVDVQAVALHQVGKLVADGGGRKRQLVPFGERLGADRFCRSDVVSDDGL